MALLRIIEGAGEGASVALGERATLGRSRNCDIQLKDVESSRFHAEVWLDRGRYYVKDLGSSNGTLVNGDRITEQELHDGDRIQIGEVVVEFVAGEDAAELSEQAGLEVLEPVEAGPLELIPAEESPPPPLPGFEIVRRLRRDELGVTWLATELAMNRPVAIEVIRRRWCEEPDAVLARVRAAAGVDHPSVAQILAAGCEEGSVFFVRRPVAGRSLWETLGKLTAQEVADAGADVAAAVEAAHTAGVIHGSIRPDRILRADSGQAVLLGLGLPFPVVGELSSKPDLQRRPNRTAYMSPEQLAGAEPDAACDVYALGAVLYHAVCGQPPFVAVSEAELAPRVAAGKFTPVLELRPETPRPLARLIERMLARRPADRPGSMAEVREELRTAGTQGRPAAVPQGRTVRTAARAEGDKGISASTIIIVILTLLLLIAVALLARVGGVWFIRQSGGAACITPVASGDTFRYAAEPRRATGRYRESPCSPSCSDASSNGGDAVLQFRQFVLKNFPDDCQVNSEVFVNDAVPKPYDSTPFDFTVL